MDGGGDLGYVGLGCLDGVLDKHVCGEDAVMTHLVAKLHEAGEAVEVIQLIPPVVGLEYAGQVLLSLHAVLCLKEGDIKAVAVGRGVPLHELCH